MKIKTLILAIFLTACAASPEFIQVSEDTFLMKRSDKGGIFGNAIKMKENMIREANEFAAKQGKVAEQVVLSETPVGIGRFAKVEYTFRLVDPQRTEEPTNNYGSDGPRDIYTDLLKLEDLHKRGILNDEEFAEQKRKLLESN